MKYRQFPFQRCIALSLYSSEMCKHCTARSPILRNHFTYSGITVIIDYHMSLAKPSNHNWRRIITGFFLRRLHHFFYVIKLGSTLQQHIARYITSQKLNATRQNRWLLNFDSCSSSNKFGTLRFPFSHRYDLVKRKHCEPKVIHILLVVGTQIYKNGKATKQTTKKQFKI